MKYLTTFIIIILILTFTSCGKQRPVTDDTGKLETVKIEKDDPVQKILDANKLKNLMILNNPNSMDLETIPRDTATIAAEEKVIEQLAEKFLKYVAENGLDAALEEVNKAKNGVFKDDLVGPYFYLPILKKTSDRIYTIIAHATSRDFIGVELHLDKWSDLTGWKYINDAVQKVESGVTNAVWMNYIYWKDPNWANNKIVRLTVYERFYKVNNEDYIFHYCLFINE